MQGAVDKNKVQGKYPKTIDEAVRLLQG